MPSPDEVRVHSQVGQHSGFFPAVFALTWGVATGVLWAYANPLPLVPGVIHWRIFAFLPPLAGVLFGPRTGFVSGYVGTVVWALLAGTFIPAHTLIVDGLMVGLTGWVPGKLVDLRPFGNRIPGRVLARIAAICLVVGVVMVAAVAASLAYLKIFPFWWALLYIGLSDIVPMVVGTPLLVRYAVPALSRLPRALPRF